MTNVFVWALLLVGLSSQIALAQPRELQSPQRVLDTKQILSELAPPDKIANLVELGSVSIDYYDRRRSDQRFEGETRFRLNVGYRFRSYARPVKTDRQTGVTRYQVSLRYQSVTTEITNEVLLPKRLSNNWDSRLVLHEFDHVRINCNPRITALAQELVKSNNRIFVDMPQGQRPGEIQIQKVLEPKIQELVTAMTSLVQHQNDVFDKITSHGLTSEIPDPNFFERIFTESMLEDLEFPYLEDARKLVRSAKYQQLDKP